ncbi:MAG: hypothetical protein Q7T33_14265 [Dehalococcoidia bacterium]|nr:hypothetical protein [Dehalococcoidia bacterium]
MAPTLKCVIAWSERRPLGELLAAQLAESAGEGNVLRLGGAACAVYTAEEPADLRDRLRGRLEEGESLLVLEFERWSSSGPAIDSRWLLARGH